MSLEEFQYKYGDPRSYFFDYIKEFDNFETYLTKQLAFKDVPHFKCNDEEKKQIVLPTGKMRNALIDKIENGEEPILLIPIISINKFRCNIQNKFKHMSVILYNRLTDELELIDIRRYHLDGYSTKILVKRLSSEFIEKYFDDEPEYVPDIDVPVSFIKKMKVSNVYDAFPTFILCYLKCRSKYPSLTSDEILKKTLKLSLNNINKNWQDYVDHRNKYQSKCKDELIEHPESNRCVKKNGAMMIKNLVITPVKECPGEKVFDASLNKCIKPGKNIDVNILLDEIFEESKRKRNKKEIGHADSSAALVIGLMNFMLSKYPQACFLYSKDISVRKLVKNDIKIKWTYNKKTASFDFTLFPKFWELFMEAYNDESKRFIIIFISLVSNLGGFHANVLIYDKKTNEVERFDGLGRDIHESYGIDEFDVKMREEFANNVPVKVKYLTPLDYCPRIPIFQAKELDDVPGKDLRGNCAVWRLWYVNLRMENPDVNRKDLVAIAQKKIIEQGSVYKFIKDYHQYIMTVYNKKPAKPKAEKERD